MQLNSEFFADEIRWIENDQLRNFGKKYADLFPDYFAVNPSSSSGKHHAPWGNGKGGLRRHTKAVMFTVHVLSDAYGFTPLQHDAALVAALGHDAVKYSLPGQRHTVSSHPAEGAMFFSRVAKALNCTDLPLYEDIYKAIADHMGRWGKYDKERSYPEDFPVLSQLVHYADMVGSRPGIRFDILEENLIG